MILRVLASAAAVVGALIFSAFCKAEVPSSKAIPTQGQTKLLEINHPDVWPYILAGQPFSNREIPNFMFRNNPTKVVLHLKASASIAERYLGYLIANRGVYIESHEFNCPEVAGKRAIEYTSLPGLYGSAIIPDVISSDLSPLVNGYLLAVTPESVAYNEVKVQFVAHQPTVDKFKVNIYLCGE